MAVRVVAVHNTQKVRPDDPFPSGDLTVDLAAAGNQVELGQVVLRAESSETGLTVSVSDLVGPEGAALPVQLLRQHYVHIDRPTTPAFEPGWYPDALLPATGQLDLDGEVNQSLWLRVEVPADQTAGTYAGVVRVGGHEVPVSLLVWDFTLPRAGHCLTAFAIWYDHLADHYGVAPWSDKHVALAEQFYWFQVERRLPPDDLPVPPDLSAEDWLAAADRFLADPRVVAFRVPVRPADPDRTRTIVEGLRARGWLDRGYFYLDEIDEPTAGGIGEPDGGDARVRELCAWLDGIAPDVPHLVTAEPVAELEGAVTTWVPLFDRYDPDDAAARASRGEQFWWYGCIYPTHPYPSYHIDDDLIAARIVPWMMHRHGIRGNLYWGTTIYRKWDGRAFVPRDPWTDPIAWPGANGDGQLIYPGPDGPVSSIRLEAIRAGQDDYEYLVLLEQALRAAAARLHVAGFEPRPVIAAYAERLFRTTGDFTRQPVGLETVRRRIAEHVVRLRSLEAATDDLVSPWSHPVSVAEPLVERASIDPLGVTGSGVELTALGDSVTFRAGPVGERRPHVLWSDVRDWAEGDVLEIDITNLGTRSTAVFVSFRRRDGVLHKAAREMLPGGGMTHVAVPLRLALMAPAEIDGFQVELMPHQPGAHLTLSRIRITTTGSRSADRR